MDLFEEEADKVIDVNVEEKKKQTLTFEVTNEAWGGRASSADRSAPSGRS